MVSRLKRRFCVRERFTKTWGIQITQKCGGLFSQDQIQITIRDFEQYLDSVTDQLMQLNSMMLGFVTVSETGLSANAEMESTWRRWAQAHAQLQAQALDDHVSGLPSIALHCTSLTTL
jgi:hypothetical protein